MTKKIKISYIIILILGITSCTNKINSKLVKIRYEYNNVYKLNKYYEIKKWRKKRIKIGYVKFDKNGNEIEIGEYGEIHHYRNVTHNSDGSISVVSGHGRNMKKLNTITFRAYNDSNQIINEEYWHCKNNKIVELIHQTKFEYLNGELIGEIEYDANGNISREMYFNNDKTVQIDDTKKTYYEPIFRVEGDSKYKLKYDSLGREIEKYHFYKGEFLRRTVTEYRKDQIKVSKYDDDPNKLWCYTVERYSNGKLVSRYWKVIDSSTETKDIYVYNKNGLLLKKLHYSLSSGMEKLKNYTEYKYKYF